MSRTILSPSKYIQGAGIFNQFADYCKNLGSGAVLVLMDQYAYNDLKECIIMQFERTGIKILTQVFNSECCMEEIEKIRECAEAQGVEVVAGIGGGKVIDTAKAAAHFAKLPLVVVPTTASMDGPCSSLSVLYEKDGTFKDYLYLTNSPNIVFVDTAIIVKAPIRLLVAGMGDALSTYFETEAYYEGQFEKSGRSNVSVTARQLSRTCLETLLEYGLQAKHDAENGKCTEAVEKIVEAIIYQSCIGFESGGLAAAHAVANALTCVPQGTKFLHGEKVAFGTLTQMLLEKIDAELVIKIRDFCKSLNLPVCLNDFGIQDEKDIEIIVKEVFKAHQPLHNMRTVFVKEELVKKALYDTDKTTK